MPNKAYMVSALEKVFVDQAPAAYPPIALSGLRGETISFQLAYALLPDSGGQQAKGPVHGRQLLWVRADCGLPCRIRRVEQVPVRYPCHSDTDEDYLRKQPGLYPDALSELPEQRMVPAYANQWQALWIDIDIPLDAPQGEQTCWIQLTDEQGEVTASLGQTFSVVGAKLPPQGLIHTRWIHYDALAEAYGVAMFDDRHMEIIRHYIALAVKRGINMVLIPIHTPPLDTRIGAERTTAQLVDVFVTKEGYRFQFDRLARFIALCQEAGVAYFEMAHLFTQWGAYHAPKIMGMKDGQMQHLFGWDSDALGPGYQAFLKAYLPALSAELRRLGIQDRCYFHISDEPSAANIAQYTAARASVAPMLQGFKVMDALSDFSFYESGAVTLPVPAIDHMAPFLEADISERWTYYCLGQHRQVSNTFMAMPASRTRMLGLQCYVYQISGFLQWGYNFWYSMGSDYYVNPWLITDADGFGPAGDAFQVYPGRDGQPVESLRLMLFMQAMQDLRALQALETKLGRERVLALIAEGLPALPSFHDYPRDSHWLLMLRHRVNAALKDS